MSRLIFVPQFPAPMRYQEFWYTDLAENFKKHYDKVIVLGGTKPFLKSSDYFYKKGIFSPVNTSIEFEMQQIRDYINLPLEEDDTLFLSDISFPGIFINALYHKRPKRMYAYCHGTAMNSYDYYAPVRKQKFMVETGHSKLFDAIFIGSYYHQNKLRKWNNTVVVGVPKNPYIKYTPSKRNKFISSVARPSIQKVNKKLEKELQRRTNIKIQRGTFNTWEEYSKFLSESRILLITSKEDTFGYTVLDALQCGCNVIAPNKLAFRELLSRDFRYDNIDDLHGKINNILSITYMPQKLNDGVQRKVDEFYDNIILYMKGE